VSGFYGEKHINKRLVSVLVGVERCRLSRYMYIAVDCLILAFNGSEGRPVRLIDVAECMRDQYHMSGVELARRGLHSAECLGYARAIPSKRSRYGSRMLFTPTLKGAVDTGIYIGLGVELKEAGESKPLGEGIGKVLAEEFGEVKGKVSILALPIEAIVHIIRFVRPILYWEFLRRIYSESPREERYLSAIIVKALAGIEVRGLRYGDYVNAETMVSKVTYNYARGLVSDPLSLRLLLYMSRRAVSTGQANTP